MVSHELRGPLTSIKGSAATLIGSEASLDPSESNLIFRIIEQQADHMSDLITDLLDVARIKAGALSISPEPVEALVLVDQAKSVFVSSGGRNNIRMDLPHDLPRVTADRRRIVQVFVQPVIQRRPELSTSICHTSGCGTQGRPRGILRSGQRCGHIRRRIAPAIPQVLKT